MTKFKLPQILRKMTAADMDMRSIDPAVHLRPEAFNGVRGRALEADIFMGGMINRHVAMPARVKPYIGAQFVSVDSATGNDIGVNHRLQRGALLVRNNRRPHVATTFHHTHDNRFGRAEAADKCLVDLDMLAGTTKRAVAVNVAHVFADFMAHAPSRFVSDAKLAFNFLGSNTVPRCAEQEHDKKPITKGCARPIKWSASSRVNLMPAILAHIGAAGGHAVIVRALATPSAIVTVAKAVTHDVFKAAILCWELFLKLAKGGGFRAHANYLVHAIKCRKGIIPEMVAPSTTFPSTVIVNCAGEPTL